MLSRNRRSFFPIAYVGIAVFVVLLLSVPVIQKKLKETTSYNRVLMGTVVEITLKKDDPAAAEAAFAEISRLEKIFSSYIPDSDVSRIGKGAGAAVKVSPEVVEVVEIALKVAELSSGAFDPTVGILFKTGKGSEGRPGGVWDFSGESNYVPSKAEVEKLLPFVDYRLVTVDKKASTVKLQKKGMTINLGGVAKGYIVGKAIKAMEARGVKWAILRAGGDLTVYGDASFVIGVQNPRDKNALLGKIYVSGGSVSSSGDYERFFIKDGVRYHHIVDPKTGFPANNATGTTILSADPTLSDALSTAVFVLGPEKGMKLIEETKGVQGIIVDNAGKIFISKGFEPFFKKP